MRREKLGKGKHLISVTKKGWSLGPSLWVSGEQLEEQLQAELDAPGDVALAARIAECRAVRPSLPDRTKEHAVEDVARVGLETNVLAFAEECILLDREVLVVVRVSTNARIVSRALPNAMEPRVRPS